MPNINVICATSVAPGQPMNTNVCCDKDIHCLLIRIQVSVSKQFNLRVQASCMHTVMGIHATSVAAGQFVKSILDYDKDLHFPLIRMQITVTS